MSFKLTILGCNSAIPTISRFTSSQALQHRNKIYLIDAGEGVQMRLNTFKIKKSKIHEVFISHLHGDHFFGLPGLLTSFNLNGRIKPLSIYGPEGLLAFIDSLRKIGTLNLNYEINIIEIKSDLHLKIFEDENLEVFTIPLKHRIPTTGFLFREKPKQRKLISENIEKHQLSIEEIKALKSQQDIKRDDGSLLKFIKLTEENTPPVSYAYCSDTIYDEAIVPLIKNVDLLYHEATYLDELKDKARERGHSSAGEAAAIAKMSGVKKLILGHYSTRYKDIQVFQDEASKTFKNVELAEDGKEFTF